MRQRALWAMIVAFVGVHHVAGQDSGADEIHTMPLVISDPAQFKLPCPLRPVRSVPVACSVPAFFLGLEVDLGATVKQGTTIGRLDNRRQSIRVQQAIDRIRVLEAAEQTDEIKLARIDATAALDLAKLDLEGTRVRAPFDGTIQNVYIETGQFCKLGDPMIQLVDTTSLLGTTPVPRARHRQGDRLSLAIEGASVEAEVVQIIPLPASMEKMYELGIPLDAAVVRVANESGRFQPGQMIDSGVVPAEPIVRIASGAILVDAGTSYVRVLRHGIVRFVNVTVMGAVGENFTRVNGAFRVEDELIVTGPESLVDGAPIAPVEEAAAAPTRPGNRSRRRAP